MYSKYSLLGARSSSCLMKPFLQKSGAPKAYRLAGDRALLTGPCML